MTTITNPIEDIDLWIHTQGFSLGSNQFTFSISTAESIWPTYGTGEEQDSGDYNFAEAALADAFRLAVGIWDSLIAPDFVEVADNGASRGELRVAYTDVGAAFAYAYSGTPQLPGGKVGDVWIGSDARDGDWSVGTFGFEALIHEIGHSFGLKHPFEAPLSPPEFDNTAYTIMSYTSPGVLWNFAQNGNAITASGSAPVAITPMVLDIAVVQAIYGAEETTRTGDDVYTFTEWEPVLQTIYDAGGNDTVDASNFTMPTIINLASGGYSSLGLADAQAQIDFWSAQFPVFESFIAQVINGESDLYTFEDNLGIAIGTVIENAIAGAGDDTIMGNDVGNRLMGMGGDDAIDGGSNIDTAIFGGLEADYSVTQTSTGVFEVVGADGTDTLTNIEFLQFDDQTTRLLNGTGVSVNFETTDTSVYQAAMNAIKDFDGNALGGDGNWLRIGSADVNGDGDVDQILVNDTIARFATVGTADDGLTYFDDHGWAGETRVAGIYIDPLVASGDVVQGSDFDSQQRFQNDLAIENINRVLGADDYDGDGLQEVYFALTDGTAYLHAYMHADGNIQYANYQSEQQVIDFLQANGFGEETYGDWFA